MYVSLISTSEHLTPKVLYAINCQNCEHNILIKFNSFLFRTKHIIPILIWSHNKQPNKVWYNQFRFVRYEIIEDNKTLNKSKRAMINYLLPPYTSSSTWLNYFPLTVEGSNPAKDLDSFMWRSYPDSLRNITGSIHVPAEVFLHQ